MMHSMLFFFILLFVQVVVESLPVSSSAHVQLIQKLIDFLGLSVYYCGFVHSGMGNNTIKFDTFLHLMHLPTLIIVLFFFRDRLIVLWKSLRRSWPVFAFTSSRQSIFPCGGGWAVIGKIIWLTALADIITVLFFVLFKLFPLPLPLGIGLIITACILYSLCFVTPSHTIWNWRSALLVGTVQGVALLPGISRFAAVYATLCWLRLPQQKAFEITWLVQWPLIFAACIESVYLLWKADQLMPLLEPFVLLMVGIATLCGLCMFYVAAYLARKGKLWWFSFYMIVPILVWVYFIF
jgi:undecaprenyl-diphosphatase